MTQDRKHGALENLKQALMQEFSFAQDTVQRLFNQHIGNVSGNRCVNCNANMLEEIFTFDYADALLLIAMAKAVRQNTINGIPFTDANSVHVVQIDAPDSVRHRTTQASKLGLIAKKMILNSASKKIQRRGHWIITTRGWAALRGELVPKRVAVFRNQIEERFSDRTTLSDALRTNRNKAAQIVDYSPAVWVEYGKLHEGYLL